MNHLKLIFLSLAILVPTFAFARERASASSNDGFFHLGIHGFYAPDGNINFTNYVEGTTGSTTITPGVAKFSTGNFTGYAVELIFFTDPFGGFSFGYADDGKREIEYKQLQLDENDPSRTDMNPRDSLKNTSYLFNYYLFRTPDRGYLAMGLNFSNPKWIEGTPSNNLITLKGDLGYQFSIGMSLVKGLIFDITGRLTAFKMRYDSPSPGTTFTDYGRGQVLNLLVGFKIIL